MAKLSDYFPEIKQQSRRPVFDPTPKDETKQDENNEGTLGSIGNLLDWLARIGPSNTMLLGGAVAETAGNTLNKLGEYFPENSWRRNLLEGGGNFATDTAKSMLNRGYATAPNANPDNYSGAFANAMQGAYLGGIGNLAEMAGSENTSYALDKIAKARANQKPVSTENLVEYFTNPRGFMSDTGQLVGSMASIAQFMPFAPEAIIGRVVAALGGDALAQALVNRGMYQAARLLANNAPQMARYGLTSAPVEGIMEGGDTRRELIKKGYDEAEANRRAWNTALENVPLLLTTNSLEGLAMLGKFGKIANKADIAKNIAGRMSANSLQEQIEEGYQQGIQNQQLDKPYSLNPYKWFTDPRYASQKEATDRVRYPAMLFGLLGGANYGYNEYTKPQEQKEIDNAYNEGSQEKTSVEGYTTRSNLRSEQNQYRNLRDWANKITHGEMSDEVFNSIVRNAQAHGVPTKLAIATAAAESQGNQDEISPVGAIGVMQLMPTTADYLGVDPHDMEQNIRGGMKYLKEKLDEYKGDWNLALAAYNAGSGNVTDHVPQNGETEHYVAKINGYLDNSPIYTKDTTSRTKDIHYLGEDGKGEGKYWIRQGDHVSFDGSQPQLLNAIDVLAKWYYDRTGKRLVVTAGTNGDHAKGEHSHGAGWKVDVNDFGFGEDGALTTPEGGKGWLADDFIKFGQSIGLGMNWEGGADSAHIDVALDGTQWDGTTEQGSFGGFNPRNPMERENETRQQSKLSPSPPPESEEQQEQKTPPKTPFVANPDSPESQALIERFANENKNKPETQDFFSGMFSDDEFQNTQENRAAIIEKFPEELTTLFNSQEPTPQPAQSNPFLNDATLFEAGRNLLSKLAQEENPDKQATWVNLRNAINNGDVATIKSIMQANGVAIPVAQNQNQDSNFVTVNDDVHPVYGTKKATAKLNPINPVPNKLRDKLKKLAKKKHKGAYDTGIKKYVFDNPADRDAFVKEADLLIAKQATAPSAPQQQNSTQQKQEQPVSPPQQQQQNLVNPTSDSQATKQQEKPQQNPPQPQQETTSAQSPQPVQPPEKAKTTEAQSAPLRQVTSGNAAEVSTDNDAKYQVRYKVVEADSLHTSHKIDEADNILVNDSFPSKLQPRNRSNSVYRQNIIDHSKNLNPEKLGESQNLNQGAPVVRSDGIVLNGNGRVMSIQRAYNQVKNAGDNYKNSLIQNAGKFGLNGEEIAAMKKPVLVREITQDLSAEDLQNIISSKQGGEMLNARENALADAQKITPELLARSPQNGDFVSASAQQFIIDAINAVSTPEERNGLFDKNGQPSQQGVSRIKNAMFALAYDDPETLSILSESIDNNIKNILNAMLSASKTMASVRQKMSSGAIQQIDLSTITQAVNRIAKARESGINIIADILAPKLKGFDLQSDELKDTIAFLEMHKTKTAELAQFFNSIGDYLLQQKKSDSPNLFGEMQEPNGNLATAITKARTAVEGEEMSKIHLQNAQIRRNIIARLYKNFKATKQENKGLKQQLDGLINQASQGDNEALKVLNRIKGNNPSEADLFAETEEPKQKSKPTPQKNKDNLHALFQTDKYPNIKTWLDDLIKKAGSKQDTPERKQALKTIENYKKNPPTDEDLQAMESRLAGQESPQKQQRQLIAKDANGFDVYEGDPILVEHDYNTDGAKWRSHERSATLEDREKIEKGLAVKNIIKIQEWQSQKRTSQPQAQPKEKPDTNEVELQPPQEQPAQEKEPPAQKEPPKAEPQEEQQQAKPKPEQPKKSSIFGDEEEVTREFQKLFGITDDTSQEEQTQQKNESETKASSQQAKPKPETKPLQQKKSTSSKSKSKFAQAGGARSFKEMFGIDDDETIDTDTSGWGLDTSDEALEKAIRELKEELSKISANPMFNPVLWGKALKVGAIYLGRGLKTFSAWSKQTLSTVGEEIRPWLSAIWETLKTFPKNTKFNDAQIENVAQMIGVLYERGITSLEGIKSEFLQKAKGNQALVNQLEPIIEAQYNGIKKFFDDMAKNQEEAEENVTDDGTSGVAERTGGRDNQNPVGRDDEVGQPSGGRGQSVSPTEEETRSQRSVRVPPSGTTTGREAGDSGVQAQESSDRTDSSRSPKLSGGVRDNLGGRGRLNDGRQAQSLKSPQERRNDETSTRTKETEEKDNINTQNEPKKPFKAEDLEEIQKQLPFLLPEQVKDVAFMERRLFTDKKEGVLLANGTGTGKTYSGLGLVKRFVNQGKKNIIIVAPNDNIIDQWIKTAAKLFKLKITKLKDRKDKGRNGEICITTYANFQDNKELVKRNWDLIVNDESHILGQSGNFSITGALDTLRQLTLHPRGLFNRLKSLYNTNTLDDPDPLVERLKKEIKSCEQNIQELNKELKELIEERKALRKRGEKSEWHNNEIARLRRAIVDTGEEINELYRKMTKQWQALVIEFNETKPENRPKVLFLSATPFSYIINTDYAMDYLYDLPQNPIASLGEKDLEKLLKSDDLEEVYQAAFLNFVKKTFNANIKNDLRTGKPYLSFNHLTPDALQQYEVAFHDELVESGAMRGRQLEVDQDYDRGFIKVDAGIAGKIDDALTVIGKKFPNLLACLAQSFRKEDRNLILESVKASAAVKLAREYAAMGKKIVIFHQAMRDAKKIDIFKPKKEIADNLAKEGIISSADAVFAEFNAFKKEFPEFLNLRTDEFPSPLQTFKKEFGDEALYINGLESDDNKRAARELFNSDTSGKNIIIVQQDAGNAGISLHDTTGKFQRVLINIGIPSRPSYAVQIEGRIYRFGSQTPAIFRYLSTGTTLEKNLFADTIAQRSQTVENLSLGSLARGLRESFVKLYEELDSSAWERRKPGNPEEGTGGKKEDAKNFSIRSRWARAIQVFEARTSVERKENLEDFQTPEPIGLKMVEWLDSKNGERVLEPSAGEGAISRWLSIGTKNTLIETNSKKAATAKLVTPNSKSVTDKFEDHNIINKYDGIVMAPPVGKELDHLEKAFKHLAPNGRLVTLIKMQENTRELLSSLYKKDRSLTQVAEILLPNILNTNGSRINDEEKFLVYVIDKNPDKKHRINISDYHEYDDIEDLATLFERLQDLTIASRDEAKLNVAVAEVNISKDSSSEIRQKLKIPDPTKMPMLTAPSYRPIDKPEDLQNLVNQAQNEDTKAELEYLLSLSKAHDYADIDAVSETMKRILTRQNDRIGDKLSAANRKIPNTLAECRTFLEMENYWKATYNPNAIFDFSFTDGGNLNFDAIKKVLSGFEAVVKQFPYLAKKIQLFESIWTRTDSLAAGVRPTIYLPTFSFTFSAKFFSKSTKALEDLLSSPFNNTIKNATFSSIGFHESAHTISTILARRFGLVKVIKPMILHNDEKMVSWALDLLPPPKDKSFTKNDWWQEEASKISAYATTNWAETTAEALADYCTNKENAKPLSKAIIQRVKEAFVGNTWREKTLLKLSPYKIARLSDELSHNLNTAATADWAKSALKKGYPFGEVAEIVNMVLFDTGLASELNKHKKNQEEWQRTLDDHTPNETILEQNTWTEEKINEVAKNTYVANLITQLGGKIDKGKVEFTSSKTKETFIRIMDTTFAPDSRYSKKGSDVDTTISEYVAQKDLTSAQKLLQDFGRKLGTRVIFFKGDERFHGQHSNGITYLNVDSNMSLGKVFWHETMHWLKANNPSLYKFLVKAAKITDKQRQEYLDRTGRNDLKTDEEIDEEIISDMFEDVAKRTGLLQNIAGKNRGLIQRVIQWLKDTMNKFVEHFHNPQGKLTTVQAKALADEFGKIANNLTDANGEKIFRYNRRTGNIELADGRNLNSIDDELSDERGVFKLEPTAEIKYSIGASNNSNQSFVQKFKAKFANFVANKPSLRRDVRITDNLSAATGYRIKYGSTSGKNNVNVDHKQKVIWCKRGYDYENLLPEVGKQIARNLKINDSDAMGDYIADWLATGAINNTSAEAREFEQALNNDPAMRDILGKVREEFKERAALTPEERYKEKIHALPQKSLWDRITHPKETAKEIKKDWREQVTDDLAPIDRMIEEWVKVAPPNLRKAIKESVNPYELARLLRGKGGVADLMTGDIALLNNHNVKKHVDKIRVALGKAMPTINFSNFKPIAMILDEIGALDNEDVLNNFETLCVAKLDKEMYEKKRDNPDEYGDLKPTQSEADADAVIAKYEKQFGQAQQDLVNYSNTMLTIMYDSGIMTKNKYYSIYGKWKNYIPTARVFDENEDYNFIESLNHEKTGSERDIWSPIQKLIGNTHSFIKQAERNKVKCEIASWVRCGGFGKIIAITDNQSPNVGDKVVFYENGQRHYLETPDISIARAINAVQNQSDGAWVTKGLKAAYGMMRSAYTVLNPNFSIGNIFRDFFAGFVHNKHYGWNPAKMISGFLDSWRIGAGFVFNDSSFDQDFFDFLAHGGSQASFVSEDTDYAGRSANTIGRERRGYFSRALDGLQKIAEYSEYATRDKNYKVAKEDLAKNRANGKATIDDERHAALVARNATIDFAKAGRSTRLINKYLLFFNPAVQDVALQGTTFDPRGKTKEEFFSNCFRLFMASVVPAVLSFALMHDDDDDKKAYKNLNAYEKETYWFLGEHAKFPKSMDIGIRLFSMLTDEALKYAWDKEPVDTRRFLRFLGDASPGFTATIATPIIETWANYSFFRDAPIDPETNQKLSPKYHYGKNTSLVARNIAELADALSIEISPRDIDHLIEGYLGTFGAGLFKIPDYVLGNKTSHLGDLPVLRRFYHNPTKNPKVVQDYYETLEKQSELYNDYKKGFTKELPAKLDMALYKRLESARNKMYALSKREAAIYNDEKMSASEKDTHLDELQKRRIELCERALGRAR